MADMNDKHGKWLLPKTLDANVRDRIMKCPYYDYGTCDLEFHYEKICPSEKCVCAKAMGYSNLD